MKKNPNNTIFPLFYLSISIASFAKLLWKFLKESIGEL